MKFKRVMSILGGILLLGATVGSAALISSYSPTSLKNVSNPAIIYGQNAATTDFTGASDIFTALNSSSVSISTNVTNVSGEIKAVETSSQPLYLGDWMNDTKTTFTKEQLPTVLVDGTISDSDGKDYDYNLRVNVPNARIIYGEGPDNLDPPVIYADFDNSNIAYQMRIIFPTAVDPSKLDSEQINLFGKTYTFSSNINDLTNTSVVLFENSQSVRVAEGATVTNNGHTYTTSIEDTDHAIIYVDGISKTVKEGFSGKINGVDVYVNNIYGPDYAGAQRYVDIYVNANSLKLENNQEVQLASNDISGTKVKFINSGSKVSEIQINVMPYQLDNEIRYLKEGSSFLDPVFNSLRFTMQGINPSLTDSNRDNIELVASREDRVGLTFTNRLNKNYDLDVLVPSSTMLDANYVPMYNSTCTAITTTFPPIYGYNVDENGTIIQPPTYNLSNIIGNTTSVTCAIPGAYTYNATKLGIDANTNLVTKTNQVIEEGDYFVTTSGEYSQIWTVTNIRNDGKVDIKDAMGGDTITLSIGSVGSTASLSLADGSSATIKLLTSTSIVLQDKASNQLYTYKGAKIVLPTDSGGIQIIEETPYNGGDFHSNTGDLLGNTLTLNWSYKNGRSGKDMFLSGTNYGTINTNYWSGNVGDNDVYSVTRYGTFIKQTGSDDKRIQIYYPENVVKASFYMGEMNSVAQTTTTTTNLTDITVVQDANTAGYQNKNIIVVGGSCINAVAAGLLGQERPVCGSEFTTLTGVTSGHYLIEAFNNPWSPGKIAVLVAGYNAEDTTRAVSDILAAPMNLTVGSKIIG